MKKYEMTEETLAFDGHVLHRIKAVRDFGSIKEGDEGGWIEKEENLFHEGCAWVYGGAKVYGNALVYEKSHLMYVANIGSRGDTTTFFRTKSGDVAVRCGCFYGDISSFEKAVKRTRHGTMHEKVYMKSIELAKLQLQG